MTSVVVVTSDPAITVAQDSPAITAIVPVTQFPQTKSGVSISTPLVASTDFNTVTMAGFYYTVDALSVNAPVTAHLWYLNVDVDGGDPTFCIQRATILDTTGSVFIRTLIGGSWGAWQPIVTLDASGRLPPVDGSLLTNINAGVAGVILNYLSGLTLSTPGSSTSFSVAVGGSTDSTNTISIKLSSAIAKTTNSWSIGSGNGALDTGSIAASTWYHGHLIYNPTTPTVPDVLISLSATAPSLPTGYTLFRRIGSMKTDGSGHWTSFNQLGDEFLWSIPSLDVSTTLSATTLYTMSVPPGVQVLARLRATASAASNSDILLNSPDETSSVAGTPAGNFITQTNVASAQTGLGEMLIRTDTNAQIKASFVGTAPSIGIVTYGWFDRRGKI